MSRKLKSRSGETLVETLFALLVVVLAMTMLAGSIVSAARVNKGAEDLDTAFQTVKAQETADVIVTVVRPMGGDSVGDSVFDGDDSNDHYIVAYQTDDQNMYCYYSLMHKPITTIVPGGVE